MIGFFWVFLGGGLGSMTRYGIGLLLQPHIARFPFATLVANALACLFLGWLIGQQQQDLLRDQHRLLLATGFCGGFSTFSTFTAESVYLFQSGQTFAGILNVLLSLGVCGVFLLLGMKFA